MAIASLLTRFTMRQMTLGAVQAVEIASVEALVGFFSDRLSHHSQKLIRALEQSHTRTWKALEIALAGESLWNRIDRSDDKTFRRQVRAYLDTTPLGNLESHGEEFRQQCLRELREARKEGLLLRGNLDADQLFNQAAAFARFTEPTELVEQESQALQQIAEILREHGHPNLAYLAALRPGDNPPLLIIGAQFFFRRAIEQDEELYRIMTWAQWEPLKEAQKNGFEQLELLLTEHAQQVDHLLDAVGEVRKVVLDIRKEIQGQRDQIQQLAQDVVQVLEQHQLQREVQPGDSLSIRNDEERRLVKSLVARYRELPGEQRRELPALLNAIGKMEFVVGEAEAARRDFQEVASLTVRPKEQAEAHYNAYQAALEARQWPEALKEIQQAAELDPERFMPFPLSKYEPECILGAGGFGVAFLCHDRHSGGRVVIKTLWTEDLDRSVQEVFAEARALEEVHHPSIIRLRYCDYADATETRPYLVMDYFEGMTLADHIEQNGTLSVDDALAMARMVAEALQAAHDKGVLHRDVKPANILVQSTGDSDQRQWEVKLIDFGLALKKTVVQSTVASSGYEAQTIIGSSVAGTLDYAAPEQMGKLPGVAVGPYSDVHGLGKTLCYAMFKTTLPLPRHWRGLSEELADLVGQCLAEDPKERPGTCNEVLQRLDVKRPREKAIPKKTQSEPETPVGRFQMYGDFPVFRSTVGGIIGAVAGLSIGLDGVRGEPGSQIGAGLILLVVVGLIGSLGAALGRAFYSDNRGVFPERTVGAGLCLVVVIGFLGLLLVYAVVENYYWKPSELFIPGMLYFLLAAVLGFIWGWQLNVTAGAGILLGVTTFIGSLAMGQSWWLLFIAGGLGSQLAWLSEKPGAIRFEAPVDQFCARLLARSHRILHSLRMALSPHPVSPPPEGFASLKRKKIETAVRLVLGLVVGLWVGMALGMNGGAAGEGAFKFHTPLGMLMGAGGAIGALGTVLSGRHSFARNFLFFLVGGGLGVGTAAAAGAISWNVLRDAPGAVILIGVWGTLMGAMCGLARGSLLWGAILGAILSLLAVGGGAYLRHADTGALFGLSVGLGIATLFWYPLPAKVLIGMRFAGLILIILSGTALLTIAKGWGTPPSLTYLGDPTQDPVITRGSYYYRSGSSYLPLPPVFSPKGDRLITYNGSRAQVWTMPEGGYLDALTIEKDDRDKGWKSRSENEILSLRDRAAMAFNSEGDAILALLEKNQLFIRNIRTGELIKAPVSPPSEQWLRLAISRNAEHVLLQTNKAPWHLYELKSEKLSTIQIDVPSPVSSMAITSDGQKALLGCQNGSVRLFDLQAKMPGGGSSDFQARELHVSAKQAQPIYAIRFSADETRAIALASSLEKASHSGPLISESVLVWDVKEWDYFCMLPEIYEVTCAAISPKGRYVLVGTSDGKLLLVQSSNGTIVEQSRHHESSLLKDRYVNQVAISPNGQLAISQASYENRACLWKLDHRDEPLAQGH